MAIKKSVLYSSLWKTCDELRGGMDASQYKDYGLVLLFVKLQCFNGAAVMRLRKGQRRCHYGTRMRRFNGAAVMRLRKARNRSAKAPPSMLLQWGRSHETAERANLPPARLQSITASMGPQS